MDNFFVPPLIFLAEKMKLSPSIAGITLLALGNGQYASTIHVLENESIKNSRLYVFLPLFELRWSLWHSL